MHKLLLIQWGNFFEFLNWNFQLIVLKKFYNLPLSLGRKTKPSRCSTKGFSSLKKIFRASQTWKLPISIFVHWKVLQHSMRRFCNGFFAEFGNSYTLLDTYNISKKLELTHASYEASFTFKASASTNCANRIITFFFKG